MLVTLNEVLFRAKQEGYGVGLFNTVDLEMAKGVLAAAEKLRSPVIIGTAEVLLPAASLQDLADILIPLAKRSTVPVVVHFDHGLTPSLVEEAIRLGFSSVMYDCSMKPYEENLQAVREMTTYAHAHGVTVEAELGHVGNADAEPQQMLYTDPKQAAEFQAQTDVDALAVAVGTLHGAYRVAPQLQFSLIRELAQSVNAPLVLHGGSGLSTEDFQHAIREGIAKINIFTDINQAQAKAAAEAYRSGMGMTDLMPVMRDAVQRVVEEKIKIFGSVGKA